MKLKIKFFAILLCVSIIPLLILSFLIYNLNYETLLEKTENQLISEVYQRGNALLQINTLRIEQFSTFSGSNEVQDILHTYKEIDSGKTIDKDVISKQTDKLSQELNKFQHNTGDQLGFHNVRIMDVHGRVIFSEDKSSEGQDFSKNPLFVDGMKKSFRTMNMENGQRRALVVATIYSASKGNSSVIGVAMGSTSTHYVDNVLLNREGLGNSGESYLVNSDKLLITPSRFIDGVFKEKVDTFPVQACFEDGTSINGNYAQKLRNENKLLKYVEAKGGFTYPDYRGIPVFGASYCEKDLGYVLLVEIDKQEVFAPLNILETQFVFIFLLMLTGIFAMTFFISRYLSEPILKLKNVMTEISHGNLNTSIPNFKDDEMGDLANEFNNMWNYIKLTNENLQNLVDTQTSHLLKQNDELKNDKKLMEDYSHEISKLNLILDKSTIIAITDKDGTIMNANDNFCKISKYSKEELIGQNHRILKSGYHSPEFYKEIWETISKGKIWTGDIKNKTKDGSFYWVKTLIIPFLEDGSIKEYYSIRIDTTKEKELQEKLQFAQRMSTIGEISSRIAHDIRNPLSVIKNNLELFKLKNKTLEDNNKEIFERIERAILRITHQIDDVLDHVRPKPLVLSEVKISEIIQLAMEGTAIPDGIIVNNSGDDFTFTCDVEKIEIVFINLFLNAIQAMKGMGKIDIVCKNGEDSVVIEVLDTGPGIPDELLPKIFDPLVTTKQTGTGLGLSSCKSIIEKHGGKIEVQSQLGKGTTFIITLPKKCQDIVVDGD